MLIKIPTCFLVCRCIWEVKVHLMWMVKSCLVLYMFLVRSALDISTTRKLVL